MIFYKFRHATLKFGVRFSMKLFVGILTPHPTPQLTCYIFWSDFFSLSRLETKLGKAIGKKTDIEAVTHPKRELRGAIPSLKGETLESFVTFTRI